MVRSDLNYVLIQPESPRFGKHLSTTKFLRASVITLVWHIQVLNLDLIRQYDDYTCRPPSILTVGMDAPLLTSLNLEIENGLILPNVRRCTSCSLIRRIGIISVTHRGVTAGRHRHRRDH